MRGDDHLAAPLIDEALTGLKASAEVQMHAAFIHAAIGDKTKAKGELDTALKADPKLADRDDVKALRDRLK